MVRTWATCVITGVFSKRYPLSLFDVLGFQDVTRFFHTKHSYKKHNLFTDKNARIRKDFNANFQKTHEKNVRFTLVTDGLRTDGAHFFFYKN